MALTVEDGTGLENADSYISVADADAYHLGRGNTAWAALDNDAKEQALRRATLDYMVPVYRNRWKGERKLATQALDWPRYGIWLEARTSVLLSDTVIPRAISDACAELALRASSASLVEDQTRAVLEESVGPVKVKYDPFSPQQARYPQIDLTLALYFRSSGGATVKLVRS